MPFEPARFRQHLDAVTKGLPPAPRLRFVGPEHVALPKAKLARLFADHGAPLLIWLNSRRPVSLRIGGIQGTALYASDQEPALLHHAAQVLQAERRTRLRDPTTVAAFAEMADLVRTHRLTGDLARRVLALDTMIQLVDTPEQQELRSRADGHQRQIVSKVRAVQNSAQWRSLDAARLELVGRVQTKQLPLAEGMTELDDHILQAALFVDQNLTRPLEAELHQRAVAYTELAQSKGFDTWAEYQLARSRGALSSHYDTAAKQNAFLRRLAGLTAPAFEKALGIEIDQAGGTDRLMHLNELHLLFGRHYPADQVFTAQAATENALHAAAALGFADALPDDRELEVGLRPYKDPGAETGGINIALARRVLLNVDTLELSASEEGFEPPVTITWATLPSYGLRNSLILIHELGHRFGMRRLAKPWFIPARSRDEVPSLLMEPLYWSKKTLREIGRAGGFVPDEGFIEQTLAREWRRRVSAHREQLVDALVANEVWNVAYEPNTGPRFLSVLHYAVRKANTLAFAPLTVRTSSPFREAGVDWTNAALSEFLTQTDSQQSFDYVLASTVASAVLDAMETALGSDDLGADSRVADTLRRHLYPDWPEFTDREIVDAFRHRLGVSSNENPEQTYARRLTAQVR